MFDLSFHIQGIGHHHDGSEAQHRVEGDDRLRQVRQLDGDSRAAGHAEPGQHRGEPIDVVPELAIRESAIEENQRRGVAVVLSAALKERREWEGLEIQGGWNALVVELMPGSLGVRQWKLVLSCTSLRGPDRARGVVA